MKPRFLLKQDFMYNKVKSKPYKDICIFLVAHKLKWKDIEPEVHKRAEFQARNLSLILYRS